MANLDFFNETVLFQTNAVMVLSVDQLAVPEDQHESYLPKYQLHKKVGT